MSNSIKVAAVTATLKHFGLDKLADESSQSVPEHVLRFLEPVLKAKETYLADPARRLAGHVGEGIFNPIDTVKGMAGGSRQLDLKNVGNALGLATLAYGGYRGGKALYNKLKSDDDGHYGHGG